MFEAQVLDLLRKYLGDYVHGLSNEALRISVWKGDVVLKDLKLKAEALNSLKLPVIVNAGFVGTITLKVPWKSLGKEPVVVLIDRVFILAHPTSNGEHLEEEDREKAFEVKLQKIEEAELATLEATTKGSKTTSPPTGNSWFSSLVATIIGNLKITISNVHIRYEDSVSNPGHPFCSGITLAKLAAVTMDENGNETFDSSGALDKLRKSLNLQRLAVYHDSDSNPWRLHKKWEVLSPAEWTEIFAVGIEDIDGDQAISSWAMNRKYLVSPINGVLKYLRLGKLERHNPEIPFEKVSIVLSDVSLTVLEAQYYDSIKFLETLSRYKIRLEVSHLRPMIPVSRNPAMWWRYAVHASLQQKKMCCKFSWERIKHLCQLRRRYVQLYASSLQQLIRADSTEIRQIERDLDSKVIVLWRLLAHAKIEFVKSKEVSQRNTLKKSWWSFGWRSASGDTSIPDNAVQSHFSEEKLTTEEWQAINKILSYNVDEDVTTIPEKDSQLMILFLIDVSIGQASARIVSIEQSEILCGRFEQLNVTTKLYHKRIKCDVLLRFCGLSAPEGTLAQTVSSEKKVNALAASFVQFPVGENVDWRLSAAIAPCHVTVYMKSYERFLGFMKRSNAVSPTVALETATVLQMKIGKVTRRAQEQFQMVLEKQSRFALNIDIDAPKLRVPLGDWLNSSSSEHFLLDFGHFTLQTREDEHDEQKRSLYSRFYILGKDIAAFFKDGHPDSGNLSVIQMLDEHASPLPTTKDDHSFYSLIDRCRMSVIVDQIKVPHPSYPSTRISIQVPNIGIHFSPARYHRMFYLMDTFYSSKEDIVLDVSSDIQAGLAPWYPAELASGVRVLVWRGFGNSSPEWKSRFIILSGIYLYVLESEISQSYKICVSLSGRHVFEVSPASVGGSCFSIAVSLRGIDVQKALESSSTLIIEFQDDSEKTSWLNGLVQATYIASAPPAMEILGKTSNGLLKSNEPTDNLGTADLVINGSLLETKLSIYGKLDRRLESDNEALILVVLANGAKVNLIRSGADLTVKMKLHSLKIKDELQYSISGSPKYMVYSLLKKNVGSSSSSFSDFHAEESSKFFVEENDIFTDALPDFTSIPDQTIHAQNVDMVTNTRLGLDDSEHCTGVVSTDGMDYGKCTNKDNFSMDEVFYETEGINFSDFVDVIFTMRYPDSLLYDGVDTMMSIRMSKLDFFCHRPTLVALIELGLDLSLVNSEPKNGNDIYSSIPDSSHDGRNEAIECSVIKGLLGHGKRRVIFHMSMNVDSVSVFLNKEDGSHLAMFVQERFLLDLKVHPSSISIEGSLGNMKLYDMSLEPNHHWGWICDIRDQIAESLIKFNFKSYFAEDDDYDGYDYQLSGHLSAVRLVLLYRFVQEIMVYFMELATPHTEEVIRFVDKVGGFERLIQKSEVDGATSLKLDLSLDAPIIIVPYNTTSKNFMQLDLGQLQIHNNFSWHGGDSKNPSAVHLDVLQAEIHGINLAVGIDGVLGNPMIKEGQGFNILVCRSLRDVFGIVPTVSIEVKIGLLHCAMSDNEYSIIVDCAYANISEEPKIPPSFRISDLSSKDSMRTLVDKVSFNGQALMSGTVSVVSVDIQHALLDLCNGLEVGSPLAQISLEGLWVSYRYTSLSESDLYVTIPKFSVLDIRPDVKAEMCLMLGSSSDVPKLSSSNCFCSNKACSMTSCHHGHPRIIRSTSNTDIPNLTMLIVDCRWRSSSKSIVIRMQQPHVLVVLDFILAVVEFFVPSLSAITRRDETSDPKNDPIIRNNHIIPVQSIHMQREEVVLLSPKRKLIIDAPGFDEMIYDGCGGTIRLIECQINDNSSSGFGPLIIIIGRGKRLRFRNVKIENGALLRKYTYLSSDSSYSVCEVDGVEISLKDRFSSDDDNKVGVPQGSIKNKDVQNSDFDSVNLVQSFSFEAQIVSPEFTFYDSSKGSMDDSLSIEKLLRVKMEMSFMFASKENDIWIRSLVKDLTVEAGSGLVVLDPLDISGAYTSVKDKTNISVIASDVCSHLSLSVASLLLQLQYQVSAALQFGNANPVATCTNFKRVWVSKKASMSGYNLTFWRPEAPSNYVILSDCLTSRPIPPTHVVMAISNTYGRVRKPFGFKLIGLFSDFEGLEEKECQSNINECSLWIPLAPPGYSAVGCVVHLGIQPPPIHTVYCIRSDLVTSTMFSDCIFTVPVNPRMPSGFSIWRIDNATGSFYAHDSLDCPSEINSLDLHHIVLGVHGADHSWSNKSSPNAITEYCQSNKVENENSTNSSGWDVLRSYSKPYGCYMSTPHFERIWSDRGTDHHRPLSIWRPLPRPGFSILGDCIVEGLEPPSLGILFKCDFSEISARPVLFTKVSNIRMGIQEAYFWYPIPPPGYASLGCVVTKTDEEPNKDSFCCPRLDMVGQANVSETPIFKFSSKDSKWSIWKVENQTYTFLARADHKRPSSRLAFAVTDHIKPKPLQNISTEMKLGSFSLSILDGAYGMITPLFDVTVININLVTHGKLEAINAVLICSIAASTFNRELEAWEPLVEPFDGIFKVETYDANGDSQSRVGMCVRVAATSTVNLNISSANLETLAESILSWRTQSDLEKKAVKKIQESAVYLKPDVDQKFSALEEDDHRKVILENRLGSDLYLRKVYQSSETVELLHHENHVTISIPPPRFSDRLNIVAGSKESCYYFSVRIFEAKELPILDDGNGHDFFCALRIVMDSNTSDCHKNFPQSARTRSVKPFVSKIKGLDRGTAKWNEVFLFEIPERGSVTLELEITNLSSKAGKGEIIGALSIPIRNGSITVMQSDSVRMLTEFGDNQQASLYPIMKSGQSGGGNQDCGILLMSTSCYDQNTIFNLRQRVNNSTTSNEDIGFWVSGSPLGPWESFGSLLALSVVPKSLDGKHFACEVYMRNGKKHVVLRPLATVINNTDIRLEISVCQAEKNLRNMFAILDPGSSAVLPWSSVSMDSDLCLQVRPYDELSKHKYIWSQSFASKTADDDIIINPRLLSKQSTSKHRNFSMSDSALMLKHLEKKDVLMFCKSSVSGKQNFWLNTRTDASTLHTDINNPIYDWRITITSPLRLENKLPYQAEYSIWEKTVEGTSVERQHGVISPDGSAFIYSVDLCRPIYLSLFVQGGWVLDQDIVLLMDISVPELASSFRMVQKQSKRKLHVSIERDHGGNIAAPKTVRLFVPYCIDNDMGIPLSYRIVEIGSIYNGEPESPSVMKSVKSAKLMLKNIPSFVDKRNSSFKRNILEVIEGPSPSSVMLSPLDYINHPLFNEPGMSPHVGIAVAAYYSDIFSPGISLYELENKERFDVKAFATSDSYYKVSVALSMASDRTKVVHFQPHTLFINRIGHGLYLRQFNTEHSELFYPSEPLRLFPWRSSAKYELLELRMDGYKWSTAFSIDTDGVMNVSLRNEITNKQMFVRVEVRSGVKSTCYEVIFRLATSTTPYRIENRSLFLPLHFRQVSGSDDSWQYLLPNSSVSFCWENLGRQRILEVLVDRTDPSKSEKVNIDDVMDHQPNQLASGPMKAICVTVVKEGKMNICIISDLMPENESFPTMKGSFSSAFPLSNSSNSALDSEFQVIFELGDFGLSIIDHMPEEILYFSLQNFLLSYSTGLETGISRFKLRVRGLQVDNQLPFTSMPVLFKPQRIGAPRDRPEYILKFSLIVQRNGSLDLCIYPYVDIQGPDDSAFLVNIHEPVIWRLHEMIQQAKLSRIYVSQNPSVSVDPIIQIGNLNISEIRFKVSMAMSPTQRPGGVLGFWLSLMTALGNTENMTVKINKRYCTGLCMRQSDLISTTISNVQRDLLSQPLQLISGVDILGNASSALGHISKGVAALSMDKKFIQSREKQESKGVEDIGDFIREGGGALAKGLFRGVTGILTKPLEGAKSSGVEGFVQGVGKGIIGVAAQPVSGVLDLLSKTTEGANAVRMKIASAITSGEQLLRKRLPRVIGGQNLIKPFDEHGATGQAILQLAESGTFFGQVDLFKIRGKFAISDAYEDHFLIPQGNILLVTHRRVLLLQQPSNIVGQKKFNPARDPCSVLWDVLWEDLVTMELTHRTKDSQRSPPSRLILYLNRLTETKEPMHVVKCARESQQAIEIYNSIDKAMNTYGPRRSKELRKVAKPCSPFRNSAQVLPRQHYGTKASKEIEDLVSTKSTFGAILPQDQLRHP